MLDRNKKSILSHDASVQLPHAMYTGSMSQLHIVYLFNSACRSEVFLVPLLLQNVTVLCELQSEPVSAGTPKEPKPHSVFTLPAAATHAALRTLPADPTQR